MEGSQEHKHPAMQSSVRGMPSHIDPFLGLGLGVWQNGPPGQLWRGLGPYSDIGDTPVAKPGKAC